MLIGLGMVVDAALDHVAELGAHFVLEESGVDVVVEVGERDLLVGHRADPPLVVLEFRYG